jgi:signal transduction histidine kinase
MSDGPAPPSAPHGRLRRSWRYARALVAPLVIWVLVVLALRAPLSNWLQGEDSYDQDALKEWLDEARSGPETLRHMVGHYLERVQRLAEAERQAAPDGQRTLDQILARKDAIVKRMEIQAHLETLGNPPTKIFVGQLPLFPAFYRMEVRFDFTGLAAPRPPAPGEPTEEGPLDAPIIWDSGLPSDASQFQEMVHPVHEHATVYLRYQLHAYNKRWRVEQAHKQRLRQLSALAVAATAIGLTWLVLLQRRERERERQRLLAQHQVHQTERRLLQEERRHEETERKLLEQRLATQAAERQALELKSQLYASIGIMAGSYAHNIKNLLVRPNDLLRRCLDADALSAEQATMLHEVQQTLGTVTERLQQILQTVRRDPSRSEQRALDLNEVVRDLQRTWADLARDKWKLEVVVEAGPGGAGPLRIEGDVSHLQQAVENLLFNARDATFEMRNHLRDAARKDEGLDAPARRQALIAAAAWRGRVVLRARREGDEVVLEVSDNGAGMSEEVRRRCTETHYSTKRDNAIYEGHSTGMGLGLSFVVAILEHHRAKLEIESAPLRGATFRVRFPAVREAAGPAPAAPDRQTV